MTRDAARKYVCNAMAVTLHRDLHELGAGWIFAADGVDSEDGQRPRAELKKIIEACEELISELERRAR